MSTSQDPRVAAAAALLHRWGPSYQPRTPWDEASPVERDYWFQVAAGVLEACNEVDPLRQLDAHARFVALCHALIETPYWPGSLTNYEQNHAANEGGP